MRTSPAVVSREQLVELLWGEAPPASDAALRAHVHLLRQAIDPPGVPRLLHTIHGVGYRLAGDPDAR
jgi:DNA-binding response OmpR family regulator